MKSSKPQIVTEVTNSVTDRILTVGTVEDNQQDLNAEANLTFDGSTLTVTGDLTVTGTTTNISTTNTVVSDKLIELANGSSGSASGDAGIVVERGNDANVFIGWDESQDKVVLGTTSATGASTGDLTITPTDLNVSDIALTPDGITTSHITTAGSLRIRATDNMHIGDDGVDSIRLGRTNATTAKIHLRSGADTDLVVSNSKVGIGTDTPAHTLDVTGDVDISGGLSFDAGTAVTSIDTDISSVSGSDDTLASAKAIKTYVDAQVTAQDLDATTDSGTIAIDLDSETLTVSGGEGIDTSATGNTITIACEDSTANNKGAVIVAGGTGATVSYSSGTATVAVDAAQTQITSVGTIAAGTWEGTAIASAYLDADTAHLSGTQTFSGAKTFSADVVISGTTPQLTIGDGGAEDTTLVFDGNAADFRVGIDDGTDTLEIGVGAAHGTTAVIKVDSSTNCQVLHNSAVADTQWSGEAALFQAGEDLSAGEVVYFKSDGKCWKAVATAAATSRCVAMCVADVSADAMGPFLLRGFARFNTNFPTWTVGGVIYTPEAEASNLNVPEQAAPDSDGDFVQIIGWAISADAVWFEPDSTVIEVA